MKAIGKNLMRMVAVGLLQYAMTTQAQAQTVLVTMPDGTTRPMGDMNGDGELNISDVTSLVNAILGKGVGKCPDDPNHPHAIDLGLPSGTKWACCNVGSSSPEDYGGHYAWGETETKGGYNTDTYLYYQNGSYVNIGSDIAGTSYDAATANWGASWCMPSTEQIQELRDNCSCEWTQQNGVNGRLFTGPNGNSVFLPAAGDRWLGEWVNEGIGGYYWSSTLYESDPSDAYGLSFYSGGTYWDRSNRFIGRTVRPVRKN